MKKHVFYSAVLVFAMLVMSVFCINVCAEGEIVSGEGGYIDTEQLFPEVDTGKCTVTVVHKNVDGEVIETWNEKGNEGEEYMFFANTYNGYALVKSPDNASGVYTRQAQTVTFVYEKSFHEYTLYQDKISLGKIYGSGVLFAASYKDETLVDAGFTDIDESNAGTDITYEELGLEIDTADIIRAFILSDTETLRPLAVHRVYELTEKRDAYSFLYSTGSYTSGISNRTNMLRENIKTGWAYDNRGGRPMASIESPITTVQDVSKTEGTAFIREFNRIDKDIIKAEYVFKSKGDGVYTEFRDEDGNSAYQVKMIDGMWCILKPDGDYEAISESNAGSMYSDKFCVFLDFVAGKSKTFINDEYCGEHELLSDNAVNFRFATDENSTGMFTPGQTRFTANYTVYENFDNFGIDEVYGWKTSGDVSVKNAELVLQGKASIKNSFAKPIKSKFAAETYVYRSKCENMALTLSSGKNTVFELKAVNGKLTANGVPVYDLTDDMWYRFRIECNPASALATVYLNGRVIAEQGLYTTEAVDSYTISSESGKTVYDNIEIFALAEHDDYAPAPEKKASLDDYIVFINVCSLWNNDEHTGWACITPYDDSKPVLGYYDEGNPETADWEINYLVNHGVDVQVFCWYNRSQKGALKESGNAAQLHDGYMYSKYGDYMKYVIMLETAATSFNSAQFRNYIVPYWFENYFLDDRYLKIDNKIVLHSWYAGRLSQSNYFGSVEAAKEEMDYLNEVAKSYGFDGMILTCADGSGSTAFQFGFEARGAYHWDAYNEETGTGNSGNTYDLNVSNNKTGAKDGQSKGFYHIPTISVGFDCVPWYGRPRDPLMSVSDFQKSHDWVKNTYIPTYGTTGTWKDRAVWLSTWNEYGEGTYMMPSGLNGFGYMDVLRNAYTDLDSSHTDLVPTEAQLERITHKYPQYARKLWRAEYETYPEPSIDYDFGGVSEYGDPEKTVTFRKKKTGFAGIIAGESSLPDHGNVSLTYNSDGSVNGKTTNGDPQIYVYDSKNVDVTNIDALRITMQIPEGQKAEVFFSTTSDKTLNQTKSLSVTATTSDLCEYIFPFASNSAWTGKLNLLRIDPVSSGTGIEFYIKNVEFIKKSPVKLIINGVDCTSAVPYKLEGDRVLFPFDPEMAMHYHLYVFHTWDKEKGVLKIEGKGQEIVYTVGEDTVMLNGRIEELGYTVTQFDGLPLIDIEHLAMILDYESRREGARVIIESPEYPMYEEMLKGAEESQKGRWEFNNYSTLGFSVNNGTVSIEDGYIHVESIGNVVDIQLANSISYSIDTTKYNQLEVRARHDYSGYSSGANGFSLYYLTDKDSSWNESKSIKGSIRTASSNGNWVTYVLSLPDAVKGDGAWKDTIKTVRFDPFDAIGYMDIDYIRLTYNPDLLPADENNEFENGSAQDDTLLEAYSANGTVTIEEDSQCDKNNVYRVVPSSYSNNYLHFLKDFTFEENTEYKVSFMARAIPDEDGNVVDIKIGCNMEVNEGIGAGTVVLGTEGEWKTFEGTFTTGEITNPDSTKFRLYAEPVIKGTGLSAYELDNITISKVVAEETVSE